MLSDWATISVFVLSLLQEWVCVVTGAGLIWCFALTMSGRKSADFVPFLAEKPVKK